MGTMETVPSKSKRVPTKKESEPLRFSEQERNRLILDHMSQVKLIARRIKEKVPDNIQLDDLISSGTLGLISAVDNFDPAKNVKLATYAEYKIRGAILDSLRALDWAPREKRKVAKDRENTIRQLAQKLGREPEYMEIMEAMGLSSEEYDKTIINSLAISPTSLENYLNPSSKKTSKNQIIEGDTPEEELLDKEIMKILLQSLDKLNPQQKEVVLAHFFVEMPLREISKKMGVDESRISQIKKDALKKLKVAFKKKGIDSSSVS